MLLDELKTVLYCLGLRPKHKYPVFLQYHTRIFFGGPKYLS